MKNLYIALILILPAVFVKAQDIHYTQYNMSPLTINPAFTGAFEGTFRLGAIYRDQWFNVPDFNGSFTSPTIYGDAPLKGFRKNHWIGVGGSIFQDQAGTLEMTFGSFMGNGAYHIGLNKDMTNTISIGIQAGYISSRLANATGPEVNLQDPTETLMDDPINYFDMGTGVMYRSVLGKKSIIELGVGAFHIIGPDNSLLRRNEKQDMRLDVHARWKYYVSNSLTLTPSLLYQGMGSANEFSLQFLTGLLIDPEKEMTLNMGLGYRFGDALEILTGLQWKNFTAGIAYDVNMSSLSNASGTRAGAFELAVGYIAKIYKRPEPKPTMLCPRF